MLIALMFKVAIICVLTAALIFQLLYMRNVEIPDEKREDSKSYALNLVDNNNNSLTTDNDKFNLTINPKSKPFEVDPQRFAYDSLIAHNKIRQMHGVPPLTLSAELNRFAQEWADTLSKENAFYHRPDNKYGENLWMTMGILRNVPGHEAVSNWYDEIQLYDFQNPAFSMATGHFTQLIWKSTKLVGCAITVNHQLKRIDVCCEYDPPGNVIGAFHENVPPRK